MASSEFKSNPCGTKVILCVSYTQIQKQKQENFLNQSCGLHLWLMLYFWWTALLGVPDSCLPLRSPHLHLGVQKEPPTWYNETGLLASSIATSPTCAFSSITFLLLLKWHHHFPSCLVKNLRISPWVFSFLHSLHPTHLQARMILHPKYVPSLGTSLPCYSKVECSH